MLASLPTYRWIDFIDQTPKDSACKKRRITECDIENLDPSTENTSRPSQCPIPLPNLDVSWDLVKQNQLGIVQEQEMLAKDAIIEQLQSEVVSLKEALEESQLKLTRECDRKDRDKRLRQSLARFEILERQSSLEAQLEEKEKENELLRSQLADLQREIG